MNHENIIRPNRDGLPAVHGTRLTVFSVMDHYLAGAAVGEISDFYRISQEEASAAIEYINAHMAELMPTYRQMLDGDARVNSPEVAELLQHSREKFAGLQTELRGQRRRAADAPVIG